MRAHCRAMRARRALSSVSRLARPEAAGQIERGLHGLAHAGLALVDAEQVDDDAVDLAADAGLERDDLRPQLRLARGRDPQRQRGAERSSR